MKMRSVAGLSLLVLAAVGCDKKESPAQPTASPSQAKPAATAAAATATASTPAPAAGHKRLAVAAGKASFLIDAPLEKIKGETTEAKGFIDLDVADLTKSKGEVSFRLTSLKTTTFSDPGKNESQGDHAHNWLDVGKESPADKRAKFEWATFTLKSVSTSTPKLADVKEAGGARAFDAKLSGALVLHGVSSDKTFIVKVVAKGPADAPTELSLATSEPWALSLKEHDVAPRDKIGSLLAGALDRIGKKIDDKVQISLEATAR